jgi:hypothetical protein
MAPGLVEAPVEVEVEEGFQQSGLIYCGVNPVTIAGPFGDEFPDDRRWLLSRRLG